MFVSMFQRAILYTKEIQDIGMFGVMVDSRLFAAFSGSPLFYVMMPLIGVLLTILAVINGYLLATASNRNFDKWFGFIISAICAVTASISLYGAVIATALEVNFAAGPWFFLGGVSLALAQQTVMLGLNVFRAYESAQGSAQRMHYVQAALNNLFVMGLLGSIVGAVVFVMLTSVAPVLGSVCAGLTVMFTLASIGWRITPYNWKQNVKSFLHLSKPLELSLADFKLDLAPVRINDLASLHEIHYSRLFSAPDYVTEVRDRGLKNGEDYLQKIITDKGIALRNDSFNSPKHLQKAELLLDLAGYIKTGEQFNKSELLAKHPLAFNSFWAERGEVEQIVDAASHLIGMKESAELEEMTDYPECRRVEPVL